MADADGAHPVQLTRMGSGHTANPRWSLDDRTNLFNSWTSAFESLHCRGQRRLCQNGLRMDHDDNVEPNWSRDGKWIYFGSDKTGRLEIYRLPVGGGAISADHQERRVACRGIG